MVLILPYDKLLNHTLIFSIFATLNHANIWTQSRQACKSIFHLSEAEDIGAIWENTLRSAESELLDTLIVGIADRMIQFELEFWDGMYKPEETMDTDDLIAWWVESVKFLEREEETNLKRKIKKTFKRGREKNDSSTGEIYRTFTIF